ncbi:MAG: DUF559 domain-containing protein [bacterium]|nr:DUF559 domain-containing protein [bacterium]
MVYQRVPPRLTQHARRMRRDMTSYERCLWSMLRKKQLNGLRFRRQHVVGPYIVDFYCAEHRLAIELDGVQHQVDKSQDERRSAWLSQQGVRVIRFQNNDVSDRLAWVLGEICRAALDPNDARLRKPPSRPSPWEGEGVRTPPPL